MLISRENAQTIAAELKSVTGHEINIIDKTGEIIGSTDRERIGQRHMGAVKIVEEGLEILPVYDSDSVQGARKGINLPVLINGKAEGVIGISGEPEEVAVFGSIIKKMTEIMVRDARRREQESDWERVCATFAEDWLSFNGGSRAALEARAKQLKIDLNAPRILAVIKPEESEQIGETMRIRLAQYIRRKQRDKKDIICVFLRDEIIALMETSSLSKARREAERMLEELEAFFPLRLHCGLSMPVDDAFNLAYFWKEASSACAIAAEIGNKQVVSYNECSADFAARCIPECVRANLCDQVFARCTKEERQTLVETLRLFFHSRGNIEEAARKAFVHRNTMYYRLNQIQKLTGYSLKIPDELFLLFIVSL